MIEKECLKRKNERIVEVRGSLFLHILEALPPHLTQECAPESLEQLYDVGIHIPTGSIYICNKGATLHTKTPETKKDYITYHIGFGIYVPNHGAEIVNVGIVGNIGKSKSIILRPESACAPSFLFGSQRCNCHDQWILARELAGHYNPINIGNLKGRDLENFIVSYFQKDEKNLSEPKENSQAFILLHMDSQNGMGSGAIEGLYNQDLTLTAFLRHRGEYSAEQLFSTSMAGGFTSLGITLDPRRLNNSAGYKVPGIILDYFGISKPIIALTNNKEKVKELQNSGYEVNKVSFYARANGSCSLETEDRRKEFGHDIPEGLETTLGKEFERVKQEIENINQRL